MSQQYEPVPDVGLGCVGGCWVNENVDRKRLLLHMLPMCSIPILKMKAAKSHHLKPVPHGANVAVKELDHPVYFRTFPAIPIQGLYFIDSESIGIPSICSAIELQASPLKCYNTTIK